MLGFQFMMQHVQRIQLLNLSFLSWPMFYVTDGTMRPWCPWSSIQMDVWFRHAIVVNLLYLRLAYFFFLGKHWRGMWSERWYIEREHVLHFRNSCVSSFCIIGLDESLEPHISVLTSVAGGPLQIQFVYKDLDQEQTENKIRKCFKIVLFSNQISEQIINNQNQWISIHTKNESMFHQPMWSCHYSMCPKI